MHSQTPLPDSLNRHRIPSFFQCPNCEKPTAMNIKAIHRALFRGEDRIVYECKNCGTEKIETMT
ncbi:hypothetical protein BH10PSE11_BH10PSE11_19710 [soil metagenome]